ncbi:MAG TPA: hypothetical protein VFY68_11085 [Nitrososphaeraceae archaeon]|nr:hypothetical protein [Nitrososphaeraceae archaeon]
MPEGRETKKSVYVIESSENTSDISTFSTDKNRSLNPSKNGGEVSCGSVVGIISTVHQVFSPK